MSLQSAISRFFGGSAASVNGSAYQYAQAVRSRTTPAELPAAAMYQLLRQAYLSNGFYDPLGQASLLGGRAAPNIKAIRSPVVPVVDFFASKLLPDPLTIVTERDLIVPAIEQVQRWSNWGQNRRLFGRYVALFGECYLKIVASQERGRVFFQVWSPEFVTDFTTDERGYLTMIRLDIPRSTTTANVTRYYTFTEHWSKDDDSYRTWETDGDASQRALTDLGGPIEDSTIGAFGISFVPFVRCVFRDLGEARGIGAATLALESIMEADLSASNLNGMVYQDGDGAWVLKASGTDSNGRPMPPPMVGSAAADGSPGTQSDNTVSVGKRSFWRLPGNAELQSVVANIDYMGALAILESQMTHLERLMPALAYARISEMSGGDLSGRAIRYKLTPAVDQVAEVRANAVAALVQANQIALTLAQVNGIPGFDGLGSFDNGDFDHEYEATQVVVIDDYERAQTEALQAQAFVAWTGDTLPMTEGLVRAGYTEERAAEIVADAANEADANLERMAQLEPARPADDAGANDAAVA